MNNHREGHFSALIGVYMHGLDAEKLLFSAIAKNDVARVKEMLSCMIIKDDYLYCIREAVYRRATEVFLFLLHEKCSPSVIKRDAQVYFCCAGFFGATEILRELFKMGLRPKNERMMKSITYRAFLQNNLEIVDICKEYVPSFTPQNLFHRSLISACAGNDISRLEKMLSDGPEIKNYLPYIVNAIKGAAKDTMLFLMRYKHAQPVIQKSLAKFFRMAIENANSLEVLHEFLKLGVNLAHEEYEADVWFYIAAREGNTPLLKFFVENGAIIHTKSRGRVNLWQKYPYITMSSTIFTVDDIHYGVTQLEVSCKCTCLAKTERLLLGLSELHVAALYGQLESLKYLLKIGMVDTPSEDGLTALHIAVHYGYKDIVLLLLEQKNNLLENRYLGKSTYDYASSCSENDKTDPDSLAIIKLLYKYDVNKAFE